MRISYGSLFRASASTCCQMTPFLNTSLNSCLGWAEGLRCFLTCFSSIMRHLSACCSRSHASVSDSSHINIIVSSSCDTSSVMMARTGSCTCNPYPAVLETLWPLPSPVFGIASSDESRLVRCRRPG